MSDERSRVLIFGASGNLGLVLGSTLTATGKFDVVGTSRRVGSVVGFPMVNVDVTDPTAVSDVIRLVDPEIIVNAAGLNGPDCDVDAELTRAVNVTALDSMLGQAERQGVRLFVFPSSSAVYGAGYREPVAEDAELSPESRYAESKVEAERVLARWNESGGAVSAVALRIFNVYGPGFSRSLVERLLSSSPDAPVPVSGLDGFARDYVNVADVAVACSKAIGAPGDLPEVINIGSGRAVTNRELIEALERRRILSWRETAAIDSYSCADISLAQTTLGYSPRESLLSWAGSAKAGFESR